MGAYAFDGSSENARKHTAVLDVTMYEGFLQVCWHLQCHRKLTATLTCIPDRVLPPAVPVLPR
jgi:hypothetical protein